MTRKLFALTLGALILGVWGQSGRIWADDAVVVEACGPGGCGHDRGCCREGVCVPITQTKKVEKRCYTDKCEQFCLPKCGGLFGGGCGSCGKSCDHGACDHGQACDHGAACHQCGHVCVKKYLIVKIKQEEECVPACKVEACPSACAAPAGTIQPMPAKPMPSAKPAAAVQQPPQVQVLEYRFMPMPTK
jgi:hypothetical protein